jgi:RNA polymerase sigma factor (sigma-70 family)
MDEQEIIPHLFRTEFSKISSVLSKLFGIDHLEIAEDIASETFLAALETWTYQGIPANPTGWLYTVAKNKTKNYLHRNKLFSDKILPGLELNGIDYFELDLSENNITDSMLQMLFTLCHPAIAPEAQIGLSLRILCGFGIDEIATAFLTNKETINKRLFRARQKLREEKIQIALPSPTEIDQRLDSVLATLYLVFSEGYYSENKEEIIREELCQEAMRLSFLLIENEHTNLPKVNALYALMCFHASRLAARKNNSGEIILYQHQDETLWNRELIAKGAYYLHEASGGSTFPNII